MNCKDLINSSIAKQLVIVSKMLFKCINAGEEAAKYLRISIDEIVKMEYEGRLNPTKISN